MFVTIRRYSPKNGAVNKASLELLRRQVQEDFLPAVQQIPGFHGHYLVSVDDRELIILTLCDTTEAALEAGRLAAEYTLRNPLMFELGCPEQTEGRVLTFAEATAVPVPIGNGNGNGHGEAAAAAPRALWMDGSRGMLLPASER